jgi:hypothetical protein
MPASLYLPAKRFIGRGTNPKIDLDDAAAGAFKAMLLKPSYTPDYTNHQFVSDLTTGTNEFSGGGYARLSLTGVSWSIVSGKVRFNATSPLAWTASGAAIGPVRHCLIYYDGSSPAADTDRELLMNIDFSTDQTAGDGTQFLVNINALGLFELN